jgi:hypothetical protein
MSDANTSYVDHDMCTLDTKKYESLCSELEYGSSE